MTPDAAPALLNLARNAANEGLKIRALRGYLRIARQFVVPDDERLVMYQTALKTALRDDERRLAIDVLIRIPSTQTLSEATGHLSNAAPCATPRPMLPFPSLPSWQSIIPRQWPTPCRRYWTRASATR
jgi:hypothetical protein